MSFLVFQQCCFCINLRSGSFIIAYLSLISRIANLIYSSVRLNTYAILSHESYEGGDLAFHRLISIISIMIIVFELLMTVALLVGLHQRLEQHLEMFYVGSLAFLVMKLVIFAAVMFRYAKILHSQAWIVYVVEIIGNLISIYFLIIIRSYYFKMREESEDRERLANKNNFYARTKPVVIIKNKI